MRVSRSTSVKRSVDPALLAKADKALIFAF